MVAAITSVRFRDCSLSVRVCRSFAELSKALDPRKDVKTDKTSIVADAIRVVTQLRAENGQLKQLNKFLEVHSVFLLFRNPCIFVRAC